MTRTQIINMLSLLNDEFSDGGVLYAEDIWLDADEIAYISLSTDENIYPDRTLQIKFDSASQTLQTRHGKKINDIFTASVEPSLITDYESIILISLTDYASVKSPYKVGRMA